METLSIQSGQQRFILLDRITFLTDSDIHGQKMFKDAPMWLGVESLAQLGAMHVRYRNDFSRHAMLLKIEECTFEPDLILNGGYRLQGTCMSQSRDAFAYQLVLKKEDQAVMTGRFLFATIAYDDRFDQTQLKSHYKRLFSCLKKNTMTD